MLYFFVIWDDQHRNTNMNNKDHLVGQLTKIVGEVASSFGQMFWKLVAKVWNFFANVWTTFCKCWTTFCRCLENFLNIVHNHHHLHNNHHNQKAQSSQNHHHLGSEWKTRCFGCSQLTRWKRNKLFQLILWVMWVEQALWLTHQTLFVIKGTCHISTNSNTLYYKKHQKSNCCSLFSKGQAPHLFPWEHFWGSFRARLLSQVKIKCP